MRRMLLAAALAAAFLPAVYGQAFGSANADRLRGRRISTCVPANGQVYAWSDALQNFICSDAASAGSTTQLANRVYAGPASGPAALPTFRFLVSADIPNNAANTSGNAGTATALAADPADCSAGQFAIGIAANGNLTCSTPTGTGVTSVSFAAPAEFSVAGSPVTAAGGFTVTKADQSANTVWAGPASGGAAQPGFRSLAAADIPANIKIKPWMVLTGDPGSASGVLDDDNDAPEAVSNDYGQDVTITGFACRSDAGSPTVTPILHGGSSTSIVTGAVTCGSSWTAGTINGSPVLHSFSANGATCSSTPCTADMNITTAGGAAKYVQFKLIGSL